MSTTVREVCEVGDLDPAAVLDAAAEAERAERRAALRKLELAYLWAVLHPATTESGVETPGGPALLADESLGGDGTPMLAAFTAEPFALALGISPSAGGQLVADALDLRHRHPLSPRRSPSSTPRNMRTARTTRQPTGTSRSPTPRPPSSPAPPTWRPAATP